MMALTKTPFLVPLITTMCCTTAHKKPLVAEKRQGWRGKGGLKEKIQIHMQPCKEERCGRCFKGCFGLSDA